MSGLDNALIKITSIVAAVWTGLGAAALADEAFVASMLECRLLSSVEERLSCYDDIVDGYNVSGAVANAAVATVPAAAVAYDTSEESFGTPPDADTALKIDQVELTVAGLSTTASGKLALVMSNGQVWRQTATSSLRLTEGDEVVIRRGSLGSYKLTRAGTKRSMKVKRVK